MEGRKDTPITLIASCGKERDADGFLLDGKKKNTELLCSTDSVWRKEFYEAQKNGIALSETAKINKYDFDMATVTVKEGKTIKKIKPTRASIDGVEYEIIRTTKAGQDVILFLGEAE